MKTKFSKIGIASYKGGVGKTSLGYSLAYDLGLNYITNDTSIVLNIYKKAKYMPKKIKITENTLYDFGGFRDSNAIEAIKQLDLLLIPITFDSNAIIKTNEFLRDIKNENINILLIANMMENEKTKNKFEKILKEHFQDIPVLFLSNSKLLKNAIESGSSATKVYKATNTTKYLYRKSYKEYKNIINYIEKV